MTAITFVEADGSRYETEFTAGHSVMETAVRANVPGIVAECGGACSCSTCHVMLDDEAAETFEPASDMESSLLDFTASERQPSSRLSCQLKLRPEHDGLIIRVAESQT